MFFFKLKSIAMAAALGLSATALPSLSQAQPWQHEGRARVARPQAQPAPRMVQPRFAQPRAPQQRFVQPRVVQPRYVQPRYEQPRYVQPRYAPPRLVQPRYVQPRYAQPRYVQPRYIAPQARRYHGQARRHFWRGRNVWFGLPFLAAAPLGYLYDDCWQSVQTPWGWGWINLCDPYWSY